MAILTRAVRRGFELYGSEYILVHFVCELCKLALWLYGAISQMHVAVPSDKPHNKYHHHHHHHHHHHNHKKDGYRQQNVRQRQKLISIIDYDVCMTFY